MRDPVTKTWAVFDCDAHVNDPLDIWERYVPKAQQELVRATYWRDDSHALVNGSTPCIGGGNADKLGKLPKKSRLGSNGDAFLGGFKLWQAR